nr:hypothetical protein [Xanthomonadales bacterium]
GWAVRYAALEGIGVVRDTASLRQALETFESLSREQPRCASRRDLISILETRNLILSGRLVARAALARSESRGQHLRQDHPKTIDEWRKWVVLRQDGDDIQASIKPVGGR